MYARFLWERKGYKQNHEITSTSGVVSTASAANIKNDYLTVSIMPQLLLGKRDQFNIGAGLYFGSLEKSRALIQYFDPPSRVQWNTMWEYDRHDYGLCFNLGYSFRSIISPGA